MKFDFKLSNRISDFSENSEETTDMADSFTDELFRVMEDYDSYDNLDYFDNRMLQGYFIIFVLLLLRGES